MFKWWVENSEKVLPVFFFILFVGGIMVFVPIYDKTMKARNEQAEHERVDQEWIEEMASFNWGNVCEKIDQATCVCEDPCCLKNECLAEDF